MMDDILLSVGAINLVGLLAMFACIGLGSALPIPAVDFGVLTGATIHAVPTVAAAAFGQSLPEQPTPFHGKLRPRLTGCWFVSRTANLALLLMPELA